LEGEEMTINEKYVDTVVVGGGVIGCSIAYYLAKEGTDVALFEKYELASGASGANEGVAAAQLYDPPLLELVLESIKLYNELERNLPIDFELDKCGSIICATEERHWKVLEERANTLRKFNVNVELIEGAELREMEPSLSTEVLGASLCSEDILVNPFKLTYAFANAARRFGANINTYCAVKRVVVKDGGVESIITDKGQIKTNHVVISAGAWSTLIEGLEKLKLPISPQRGQVFVTEPIRPLHFRIILDADYLITATTTSHAETFEDLRLKRRIATALSQTRSGNILIGSSRDLAGYDKRTTILDLKIIATRASKFLPFLSRINVIRTFAGLRPYSHDDLPILGEVPSIKGLFIATGHCGNGIALAPVTGKIIADLITKGKSSIKNIDRFSVSRFKA
jgi:sarcosine oxidase subunit beta